MKKYYFVYGYTESRTWLPNSGFDHSTIHFQDVIDVHPIQYQIDCNALYEKPFDYLGGSKSERYVVTNWQELTREEYKQFKGCV